MERAYVTAAAGQCKSGEGRGVAFPSLWEVLRHPLRDGISKHVHGNPDSPAMRRTVAENGPRLWREATIPQQNPAPEKIPDFSNKVRRGGSYQQQQDPNP